MQYSIRSGIHPAGVPVGVIMMDAFVPYPPGSPNNARTFGFPVTYETLEGLDYDRLIYDPDLEAVGERVVKAGRALVSRGVRAVVGSCGFMVLFQKVLADALDVPVFSSSLIQLPMVAQTIASHRSVGILTFSRESLTERHMNIARAGLDIDVVIHGLADRPAFRRTVHEQSGILDFEAMERDVVDEAVAMQKQNLSLGAILLECTDLPPYADAVAAATALPVYDIMTLIRWAHDAVEPVRYPHVRT